jgi:hypothetical protein
VQGKTVIDATNRFGIDPSADLLPTLAVDLAD